MPCSLSHHSAKACTQEVYKSIPFFLHCTRQLPHSTQCDTYSQRASYKQLIVCCYHKRLEAAFSQVCLRKLDRSILPTPTEPIPATTDSVRLLVVNSRLLGLPWIPAPVHSTDSRKPTRSPQRECPVKEGKKPRIRSVGKRSIDLQIWTSVQPTKCSRVPRKGRKNRLNTNTGLVIQAVHSVPEVVKLLSAKEKYLEWKQYGENGRDCHKLSVLIGEKEREGERDREKETERDSERPNYVETNANYSRQGATMHCWPHVPLLVTEARAPWGNVIPLWEILYLSKTRRIYNIQFLV